MSALTWADERQRRAWEHGDGYQRKARTRHRDHAMTEYRVTRPYFNKHDNDHLRIARGDVVEVAPSRQQGVCHGWLFGACNGRTGIFPANHVEPASGPTDDGDDVDTDQLEQTWTKKDGVWTEIATGVTCRTETSGKAADTRHLNMYEAMHSYRAREIDELSINRGDLIYVDHRKQADVYPGWLMGSLHQKFGIFPKSFVKLVTNPSDEKNGGYTEMRDNEMLPPFGRQTSAVKLQRKSIDELFEAIDDFCMRLEDTKEDFMSQRLPAPLQEEIRRLMEHWDSLIKHYRDLSRALRSNEKVARDDPSRWMVGEILCEKLSQTTKIKNCCNWRKNAETLMQKQSKVTVGNPLAGLFKNLEKPEKSTEFDDGKLIKVLTLPTEQAKRFPNLINNVIRNTPADHLDYERLCEAYAISNDVCIEIKRINEEVKHTDEMARIQEVVKGADLDFMSDTDCLGVRKLIYTSRLQELKGGQKLDRVGFLFNDQLLMVHPVKPTKTPEAYMANTTKVSFQASRCIYLNNIEILLRETTDPTLFVLLCFGESEVTCLNLMTETSKSRKVWVDKLEESITNYSIAKRKRLLSRNITDAETSTVSCVAKYRFTTDNPECLTFTPGTVIKVGSRQEGASPGWMFGSCQNKSGWFPRSFVEPQPERKMSPEPDIQQREHVIDSDHELEDPVDLILPVRRKGKYRGQQEPSLPTSPEPRRRDQRAREEEDHRPPAAPPRPRTPASPLSPRPPRRPPVSPESSPPSSPELRQLHTPPQPRQPGAGAGCTEKGLPKDNRRLPPRPEIQVKPVKKGKVMGVAPFGNIALEDILKEQRNRMQTKDRPFPTSKSVEEATSENLQKPPIPPRR